jgi:hypothetical protein
VTILTELVDARALEKALVNEIGQGFALETVATGSSYGDSVGLLVVSKDYRITESEAVRTGGKKMPYILKAAVASPLGNLSIAAMRGAYVSGKGGWLTSGSAERKAQYKTAIQALEDEVEIALIGGDTNSLYRTHDPIFVASGYDRLSGLSPTWPDESGINKTTKDAQLIAKPFLLLGMGFSIDAIYGRGPIKSVEAVADATGLSDHMYLGVRIQGTEAA